MSEQPTRRSVLRTATGLGSVAAIGPVAAAESRPSVRLIEAGIRYDVPERDDYVRFHLDSRPQYAVRGRSEELLVRRGTARGDGHESADATADESADATMESIVDERRVTGGPVSIDGSGETVPFLPTALSARKRVRSAIHLAGAHALPTVTVHGISDDVPAVTIGNRDRIELPPGTTREIALGAETVDARTVVVTDALAEADSVPDWQVGRRRETGTATVEVVPVVELANRGELSVSEGRVA